MFRYFKNISGFHPKFFKKEINRKELRENHSKCKQIFRFYINKSQFVNKIDKIYQEI